MNDVHFGELECGLIEGMDSGPRAVGRAPGDRPYPEVMNEGAIAEMAAIDPAAVVVKGDLTATARSRSSTPSARRTTPAFGDRLHYVRGNHDAYHGATFASDAPYLVEVPGARLAVIDTTVPRSASGRVEADTLEWLDELAARPGAPPLLVFGHHHVWNPDSDSRPDGYFGVHPDDSEALVDLVARRPAVIGYFAGHTHRNRVRRFAATGTVPWVEVACVEGLPWGVGRVPGVRRRRPPGVPPHRHAGRARLVGANPRPVRRLLPDVRLRRARRPLL